MKHLFFALLVVALISSAANAEPGYNAFGEVTASGYVKKNGVTLSALKGCMVETTGGAAVVQFYNGLAGDELTPAINVASGETGFFTFDGFHVLASNGVYVVITNAIVVVYGP